MRYPDRPRCGTTRAAFSVMEVLFALVLVSVGLLGMAGTSALAIRSAALAAREHQAARIGAARLARLTAAGCSGTQQSGEARDSAMGVREQWTVDPPRNGGATLQVRVEWTERGRRHTLTLEGGLLC